jgi:hypothetical protein
MGFCVRAMPQPVAAIPLADTHVTVEEIVGITYDPITELAIIEITPARASWAADALKGKFLTEEDNFQATCAIYGSDSTHLYVCNRNTPYGEPFAGGALDIVECSATLEGTITAAGDFAAIEVHNCPQISFHGIKMTCLDPDGFGPYAVAFCLNMSTQPNIEMCDIQGFGTMQVKPNFRTQACVLRDRAIGVDASAWTVGKSLVLDVPVIFHVGSDGSVAFSSVFDGCPALECAGGYSTNDSYPSISWTIANILFQNGTDPRGAVFAHNGGLFTFDKVEVNNPAGPGIYAEGNVYLSLNQVGGESLTYGIEIHDGARVRVLDDDTVITGDDGDMKVGTLATRTWADFRTALPGPAPSGKGIKNEYDVKDVNVAGFAVGDEVTGDDTGGPSLARIFQRPLPV